jgi:peptidoglycan hydrolase-like protein with peptidoglycan-binding domain
MIKDAAALAIISAVLLSTPQMAEADDDFIKGIVAGTAVGIFLKAIDDASNNGKGNSASAGAKKNSTVGKTSKPSAQRGDVEIQRALNFFGFNAGAEDGIFGRGTREAIKRFQIAIDAKATGTLSPAETSLLLSSYNEKKTGGGGTGNPGSVQVGGFAALVASISNSYGQGTATTSTSNAVGSDVATLPGQDASVLTASSVAPSRLVEVCSKSEQEDLEMVDALGTSAVVRSYCSAIGSAMSRFSEATAGIPGFDFVAASEQCREWVKTNRATLDVSATADPDSAVNGIRLAVPQSEPARNGLVVCFGVSVAKGVETDLADFAMAAASLGDSGFGEIVAGANILGIGRTKDAKLAQQWYAWTLDKFEKGDMQLVVSDGYDRRPLLRALSESAPTTVVDLVAYLDATRIDASTASSLPGMAASSVAHSLSGSPEALKSLPPNLDYIIGVSSKEALESCISDGPTVAVVGLGLCRTLASAAGNFDLSSRFDERIKQIVGAD